MSIQSVPMASLLMLVACSVPPQAQEEPIVLPVIVVEETTQKSVPHKEIKVPAIKPKHDPAPAPVAKSTADTRCPPTEGETEQQRIIRKLDCLLERD